MKKFFAILSIAALAFAVACNPENNTDEPQLPSAAGIIPVVTVAENVATFSLPEGTTGLIPIWYTNESGDFAFAGNGNNFQKTFFVNGTFKVRMYVSNANGQSKDYSEAEFTIDAKMEWNGYNYDSQYNIWKAAEAGGFKEGPNDTHTWCSPGWAGEVDVPYTTNPYTLTVPGACSDRWQCQFHISTNTAVTLSSEKNYDFSCIIELTKSAGVTVKVPVIGDDNTFLFDQVEELAAGTNIFYMKNVKGVDGNIKVVFDFGYSEAGNNVKITRITLKDHADDDGTNAPDKVKPEEPEKPEVEEVPENYVFNVNTADNLWKAVADANGEAYYYYVSAGDAWGSVYGDTLSEEVPFMTKNGNSYALTYDNGTNTGIWFNQFFIYPKAGSFVALDGAKKYALQLKLSATLDCPGFFKLEQYNAEHAKREGALIWEFGEFSIKAGEEKVITAPVISGVACDNINLIFAFGGASAGTVVTIKDICLQEYK